MKKSKKAEKAFYVINYDIKSEIVADFQEPLIALPNISNQGFGTSGFSYPEILSGKMQMISAIKHGVPYKLFELIQKESPFSELDWANFLDMSTKSLQRFKLALSTFKSSQSEKIIEIAEVCHLGLAVFSSMEKFKLWLKTPSYALGNFTPFELIKNS